MDFPRWIHTRFLLSNCTGESTKRGDEGESFFSFSFLKAKRREILIQPPVNLSHRPSFPASQVAKRQTKNISAIIEKLRGFRDIVISFFFFSSTSRRREPFDLVHSNVSRSFLLPSFSFYDRQIICEPFFLL